MCALLDPEEPLHEYDVELRLSDQERMNQLMDLKEAIQSGSYDVDGEWCRLVQDMRQQLTDGSDPVEGS